MDYSSRYIYYNIYRYMIIISQNLRQNLKISILGRQDEKRSILLRLVSFFETLI